MGENKVRASTIFSLAVFISAMFFGDIALAGNKAGKKISFEPIDTVDRVQTDFPYEAEFRFKELPSVGDSAVLYLKLRSGRDIADTVRFTLRALPAHYVELGASEISWPSPRKRKTFEVEIPIRFLMGGSYSLLFEQLVRFGKRYNLYSIAISFGFDGRVIYFGEHPSPVSSCPGHFYTYNMKQIRIFKKNEFEGNRRRMGIPFDIDLTIYPVPRLNETSRVEFTVITNSNFIHDIQFQWVYSPNLILGNMPQSWGGRPRAGDSYSGGFEFTPKKQGAAIIEFMTFGKNIYSKLTGKAELEIRLSMIFDSTGVLLYLGEADLSRCKFSDDDPLGKQLGTRPDAALSLLQPRIARSQPDFEAIERREQSEQDSAEVDPSVADSIMRMLREEGDR